MVLEARIQPPPTTCGGAICLRRGTESGTENFATEIAAMIYIGGVEFFGLRLVVGETSERRSGDEATD